MKPLTDKGIEVVGVSGDSAKTQAMFKKHNKLPFTLLGDEKGEVAKKFGVPVGKGSKVDLKKQGIDAVIERGVTTPRWTFVIGKDGTILYKNTAVKAAEDRKQILEAVEKQGK